MVQMINSVIKYNIDLIAAYTVLSSILFCLLEKKYYY